MLIIHVVTSLVPECVILSEANVLSMTLLDLAVALWQGESVALVVPHAAFLACHAERSEGSGSMLIIHVVTSLVPECVILSEAKDLARRMERSFAEFTLSATNGLSMTGIISKCLQGHSYCSQYDSSVII